MVHHINPGGATNGSNNYSTGCTWDGVPADCNSVKQAYNDGWVNIDPRSILPWTDDSKPNYPTEYIWYHVEDGTRGMFIGGDRFADQQKSVEYRRTPESKRNHPAHPFPMHRLVRMLMTTFVRLLAALRML